MKNLFLLLLLGLIMMSCAKGPEGSMEVETFLQGIEGGDDYRELLNETANIYERQTGHAAIVKSWTHEYLTRGYMIWLSNEGSQFLVNQEPYVAYVHQDMADWPQWLKDCFVVSDRYGPAVVFSSPVHYPEVQIGVLVHENSYIEIVKINQNGTSYQNLVFRP